MPPRPTRMPRKTLLHAPDPLGLSPKRIRIPPMANYKTLSDATKTQLHDPRTPTRLPSLPNPLASHQNSLGGPRDLFGFPEMPTRMPQTHSIAPRLTQLPPDPLNCPQTHSVAPRLTRVPARPIWIASRPTRVMPTLQCIGLLGCKGKGCSNHMSSLFQ